MPTIAGNLAKATEAGYEVLDHFALPDEAWWPEYYTPLEARLDELQSEIPGNPALENVINETRREIQLRKDHGNAFGYVYYLLQKAD